MSDNNVISNTINEMLIEHLVNIEEEKLNVVENFFSTKIEEKYKFESFINNYIKEINNHIQKLNSINVQENLCPFAIIGSTLEVEDLEDGEIFKLHIVSPFNNNVDHTADCASYLSPIGQALLLKRINDIVNVRVPAGQFKYKIKSISI